MPWQKGQSGNPAGAKRQSPTLTPALRILLGRRTEKGGPTNGQKLAQSLLDAALAGDIAAMKLIYERVDGKLANPVEFSNPLSVVVTWPEGIDADA